jgi:mRNA-degrading endonuclease toxin of MazEF toxin-antitoxin module
MQPEDLAKLEALSRKLASSAWPKLALLRLRSRREWFDAAIDRLYAGTQLEVVAGLSRERAEDGLIVLREMQGNLRAVARAIPFERRLPPLLRPLRHTFQQIIRLRNATECGIAALRLRLEGPQTTDLGLLHLPAADILDARERMLAFAPGWADQEMNLYDASNDQPHPHAAVSFRRGDVVLVLLAETGGERAKQRPAVVLHNTEDADTAVSVVPLTPRKAEDGEALAIERGSFEAARMGLVSTLWLDVQQSFDVPAGLVVRKIGQCPYGLLDTAIRQRRGTLASVERGLRLEDPH